MGAVTPLRQQRADGTRQRLFSAAVELLSERGYFDTTVEEICRRAGVAKGTFFLHYTTKHAVVTALVRRQVAAARAAREQALANGTAIDALRATVFALGQQASLNRGLSRAVLTATLAHPDTGESADRLFNDVFQDMIQDARCACSRGFLARGTDPRTVASTLMSSYLGAVVHFTTSPSPPPLGELLASIVEANLRGFLPRRSSRARRSNRRRR